jgi:hypothetical protein
MTSTELESLASAGRLKREAPSQAEFDGLFQSGSARLKDAQSPGLAPESRFDLAYNAAHALALAALRWHGYRSDARYLVFQVLPYTAGLGPEVWRVLDKAHSVRNQAEYEGYVVVDERLFEDLVVAARWLETAVSGLGPVVTAPRPG